MHHACSHVLCTPVSCHVYQRSVVQSSWAGASCTPTVPHLTLLLADTGRITRVLVGCRDDHVSPSPTPLPRSAGLPVWHAGLQSTRQHACCCSLVPACWNLTSPLLCRERAQKCLAPSDRARLLAHLVCILRCLRFLCFLRCLLRQRCLC